MTKSQKIQEAYGTHWEKVKDFVSQEGAWINMKEYSGTDSHAGLAGIEMTTMDPYHPSRCYIKRPTVLDGINDNNGWINIESEADLPTEPGSYFTKMKFDTKNTFITKFPMAIDSPESDKRLWLSNVIAYQKVIFPKDKIY